MDIDVDAKRYIINADEMLDRVPQIENLQQLRPSFELVIRPKESTRVLFKMVESKSLDAVEVTLLDNITSTIELEFDFRGAQPNETSFTKVRSKRIQNILDQSNNCLFLNVLTYVARSCNLFPVQMCSINECIICTHLTAYV